MRSRFSDLSHSSTLRRIEIIFVYASATSGQQMSESHDFRRRGPTAGATGGHFEERGTSYWFVTVFSANELALIVCKNSLYGNG